MPRRRYSRGYAKSRRRYGGKGGALTGGTGDVNPQWFNLTDLVATLGTNGNSLSATTNIAVSAESIIPLQQQALMASRGSKSMVMEVLKVEFSKTADTSTIAQVGRLAITTKSIAGAAAASTEANVNQPHVVASMDFDMLADSFNWNVGTGFPRKSVELTDVRSVFQCSCRWLFHFSRS